MAKQGGLPGLPINKGSLIDLKSMSLCSQSQGVKKEKEKVLAENRTKAHSQEMREFKQCTFEPVIHDAPEYVKRIAKSMQLVREAKKKDATPAKPGWI